MPRANHGYYPRCDLLVTGLVSFALEYSRTLGELVGQADRLSNLNLSRAGVVARQHSYIALLSPDCQAVKSTYSSRNATPTKVEQEFGSAS